MTTMLRKIKRDDAVGINNFFEATVPMYSPSTFSHRFRMNLESFRVIVTELSQYPELITDNIGGRKPVPLEKSLAMVLWTMATNENLQLVSERFKVSVSTVHIYIRKLIEVISTHLVKKLIKWPDINQKTVIAREFESKRGFPGVIGAVDGSHIPIQCPDECPESYINRKGFHSILLQGVCDSQMLFIDCNVGWPGSVHDARVFRNSYIGQNLSEKCSPDFHLLGDAAYPLSKSLMTPFKNTGNLQPDENSYNFKHSSTRMVIERAFGLLKGRFRILKFVRWLDIQEVCKLVISACVLHNICLQHDEDVLDLIENIDEDDDALQGIAIEEPRNTSGTGKRNRIKEHLMTV